MEAKVTDDRNEFLLCLCPYMVGMKEAWVINKVIYVSPALFQLLTDEEDLETIIKIANQLSLKAATHDDLQALARRKREMAPVDYIHL
jgi:hypothetical protein